MLKDYSDMKKQIDKQLKKYNNVESLMQYFNVENLYKIHVNDKIRMYKKGNIRMYNIVHENTSKSTFFFDTIYLRKWGIKNE